MAWRHAAGDEPCREPILGLADQLRRFVLRRTRGEGREDRLAGARPVGAAARDLDRAVGCLRQVGEQGQHLRPRLEAVLGRELPPLALADNRALGDADQRVMRLVVRQRGEIRLVGGDERQAAVVGEIDKRAFDLALLGQAMALQLDVEAAVEQPLQHGETGRARPSGRP